MSPAKSTKTLKRVIVPVLLLASLSACQSGARSGGSRSMVWSERACAAPLVGGVVDDNVRLPEFLDYVAAYPHGDVPKLDLTDRRVMTVVGDDGVPLWDVGVTLSAGAGPAFSTRTNAAGQFVFPPAALGIPSSAPLNAFVEGSTAWTAQRPGDDVIRAPGARRRWPAGVPLDVALVIDTTGSMADEVDRLRSTLQSVVARIGGHALHPDLRIGGVAYRDVGDTYVTRTFDFTSDMRSVQRTLDRMEASGGGDQPEAVQQALDVGVKGLSWRPAGAVRILFLIGDAPPHFDQGTPYTVTMRAAVERGITVVPIACSGMDDTGEFVWRQLAAVTLGTFLFVSYGGETEHHVGPYPENDLDTLMISAVWRSLDALSARPVLQAPAAWTPPFYVQQQAPPPYAPTYVPVVPAYVPPPAPVRVGWGRAPWDFGIPGWTR